MKISERDLSIIKKIYSYCREIDEAHIQFDNAFSSFQNNSVYRNAVCLCLMQIGELSNHLSEEFKNEYRNIPWRAIRGMRNVVAHEYGHIDVETVWETADNGTKELSDFCKSIIENK
ncbi:MAG: DUF86 domain-containing protein [Eubacterium sp.]